MTAATWVLAIAVVLGACTTAEQRRAAEREAIRKQAASEVDRICALPPAERDAELEKLKKEAGFVLHCGEK